MRSIEGIETLIQRHRAPKTAAAPTAEEFWSMLIFKGLEKKDADGNIIEKFSESLTTDGSSASVLMTRKVKELSKS